MVKPDRMLGMYLHLVRASDLRRQPLVRDKLLVLAGVHAEEMGLEPIAALCRHKVLDRNARHLVRQWPTLGAALADDHFRSYLKQLKRRFTREKVEHMVDSLGIELGREREAYFSDLEYAAALLDARPESIAAILEQPPSPPQEPSAELPFAGRSLSDLLIVWTPIVLGIAALAGLARLAYLWNNWFR